MNFFCTFAKRFKDKIKKIKIAEILSDEYYDWSEELTIEEEDLFD